MATCSAIGASIPTKNDATEIQKIDITVNIGIFFDGTANHRLQVTLGKIYRNKDRTEEKKETIIYDFALDGLSLQLKILIKLIRTLKEIEPILSEQGPNFNYTYYNVCKDVNIKNFSNCSEDNQKKIEKIIREYEAAKEKEDILALEKQYAKSRTYAPEESDYGKDQNINRLKEDYCKKYGRWDYPSEETPELTGLHQKEIEKIWETIIFPYYNNINSSNERSRNNEYTNIALLEPLYNPNLNYNKKQDGTKEYSYRIYVTGSGTLSQLDKDDSVFKGLGLGQDYAGVVQKVADALDAIKKITSHIDCNNDINKVKYIFHLFGFSRGATEARLFVDLCSSIRSRKRPKVLNKIINKYTWFKTKDDKIIFPRSASVTFQFVGLFDTVSSVGVNINSVWNPKLTKVGNIGEKISPVASEKHQINIEDLGLNTLVYESEVKKIVHICALDEYRENFALVSLPIPNNTNKVEQFFLPGAHADIGGGYLDGLDSIIHIPKFTAETISKKGGNKDNLYITDEPNPEYGKMQTGITMEINIRDLRAMGWIKTADDCPIETAKAILVRRFSVKGYSYLPLCIMAGKSTSVFGNINTIAEKYKIPDDLPSWNIEKWKSDKCRYGTIYFPKEKNEYTKLREKYLHFSSSIDEGTLQSIVDGPNYVEMDKLKNKYLLKRYIYEEKKKNENNSIVADKYMIDALNTMAMFIH